MTEYHISIRIVDGKPRKVVINGNNKVVNRSPSKEELIGLKFFEAKKISRKPKNWTYDDANMCTVIREDGELCGKLLVPENAYHEHDKNGNDTGRLICKRCHTTEYNKLYYRRPGGKRYTGVRREGNQDPNSAVAKGDLFQKLANISRNLVCLNEMNDNYLWHIDSICPITKLNYQIKGRLYDPVNRNWTANLKNELNAIMRGFKFYKLIFYCASKDGKVIERMYEFPEVEVKSRKGFSIMKNPTDSHGKSIIPWDAKYRITDKEELKRINNIWKDIIEKI